MKFMMFLTATAFFTILGILSAQYYQNITAMQHGLKQCVVNTSETRFEVIWTDVCK